MGSIYSRFASSSSFTGFNKQFTSVAIHRSVADNFDMSIKSRIQTKQHNNQSIHWTNQYAIKDRVVCDSSLAGKGPKCSLDDLPLQNLLPTASVQKDFKSDCLVLVGRVVTKYLPAFQHLKDVVPHHIPHPYLAEMSRKSEYVSFKNSFNNNYLLQLNK